MTEDKMVEWHHRRDGHEFEQALGIDDGQGSLAGEENGNPFQCSCLENPRDCGAWWAAVYGVAQSWTQPKGLSSSSCSEAWRAAVHGVARDQTGLSY